MSKSYSFIYVSIAWTNIGNAGAPFDDNLIQLRKHTL